MSLNVAAETIEVGDRIEVPEDDGVITARVDRIAKRFMSVGFEVTADDGRQLVWGTGRSDSVNLVC
jgi:TusA-related sulfurtransferase